MGAYVIGDSHGQYLFARAGAASLHCLPGHTMHRAGRDGISEFLRPIHSADGDTFILVFGEIDVRCHLLRLSIAKGIPLEELVNDLAERFVRAAKYSFDSSTQRSQICLMGIVPPIDPLIQNPILPVFGSLEERLLVWFLLNEALKVKATDVGFSFVPIPKAYRAHDGSLKRHLSDGHAHIAKDCTETVVRAVEITIGRSLEFRAMARRRHLLRNLTRRIAIANGDYATLWTLGESIIDA